MVASRTHRKFPYLSPFRNLAVTLISVVATSAHAQQPDPAAGRDVPAQGQGAADGEATAEGEPSADGDAAAEGDAAVEAAGVAAGPLRDVDVDPLDLCQLAPATGTGRYQTQRVLLLDVAEDPSMKGAPEFERLKQGDKTTDVPASIVKGQDVFGHAREVLLTTFPMRRLYIVHAQATPSEAMKQKEPISASALRAMLVDDRLGTHAAACADWLAAPSMRRGDAVWTKVKRKKTVYQNGKSRQVEYLAWELDVPFSLSMEVYRRQGDGFVHHASLSGSSTIAARDGAEIDWNDPASLYAHVSAGVPGDCPTPVDGQPAFGGCGGVSLDFGVDGRTVPGGSQKQGAYCQGIDDAVSAGQRVQIARCAIRDGVASATIDLQLSGKKMCGWKLFDGLQASEVPEQGAISLGSAEGAKRGDYYVAHAAGTSCGDAADTDEELGFGRIVRLGPGGTDGAGEPSLLKFRKGNPPSGARMTEYPLHGFRGSLQAQLGYLLSAGDVDAAPLIGGGLRVGYDLSRYLPFFDEMWSVAGFDILASTEEASLFNIDVGLEATTYKSAPLAIVYGLGIGILGASTSVELDNGESLDFSGSGFGVFARAGVEYALRPEWQARLMAEGRAATSSVELEDTTVGIVTIDAGNLVQATLALSIAYTY